MSKLTPEQKALNKEAVKLRQKVYAQRYKEYRAALDAAANAVKESAVAEAERSAQAAFDRALDARKRELDAIQSQIDALTIRLAETKRAHDAAIEPVAAARQATMAQLRAAKDEAESAVKSKYPDLASPDCWSAASWKPLEEFIPLISPKNS